MENFRVIGIRQNLERAQEEQRRLNEEFSLLGARERVLVAEVGGLKQELTKALSLKAVRELLAKITATELECAAIRQLQVNIEAGPLRSINERVMGHERSLQRELYGGRARPFPPGSPRFQESLDIFNHTRGR